MPVQQIIWDPRIGDRYQTQGGQAAYSAANNSAAFTATAAQIAGSGSSQTTSMVILDCTVGTAGGANITLPTVAAVGVQIAEAVGSSWVLRIKNSAGAGTWTVVTNTGWTLTGTMTTGVPVNVRGCDHYTFRAGKVVRKDSYWKIVE